MKQTVNDATGFASRLVGRRHKNLTIVNQGQIGVAAIGALTEAGNVVTFTLTNPSSDIVPGQPITVVGALPNGYNGVYNVTAYNSSTGVGTYNNPTGGLAASTAAANIITGCDVYFETSAVATRLNASAPGTIPSGTKLSAGGGQVQFTDAPEIWMRAILQTTVEVQP